MMNDGCIDVAIRKLMDERNKTKCPGISDEYEWNINILLSDDIGFEFMITEQVFQTFDNNKVIHENQVKILTSFIFQLIEDDLENDIGTKSKWMS